jgi:hypothetical protein
MPGTGIIHDQGAYVNDYAIQPPACTRHIFLGGSVIFGIQTMTSAVDRPKVPAYGF